MKPILTSIFSKFSGPFSNSLRARKENFLVKPTPSPPCYSRLIRIRFIKGTNDVQKEEIKCIKSEFSAHTSTQIEDVSVKRRRIISIADGKVCSAAAHMKSMMRCYICRAN